jgi:uncharacterized protein
VTAVDTNILVYAHRRDSKWHQPASQCVKMLAEASVQWLIPWPCIHEFIGMVTHPRAYSPPSTLQEALAQIDLWAASPTLVLGGESATHLSTLRQLLEKGKVIGPMVHDARVAAICLDHGVDEFLTADRDFSRFPDLKTRNPLI